MKKTFTRVASWALISSLIAVFTILNLSSTGISYRNLIRDSLIGQTLHPKVTILHTKINWLNKNLDTNAVFNQIGPLVALHYNDPFPQGEIHFNEIRTIPISIPIKVGICARNLQADYGLQVVDINDFAKTRSYVFISKSINNASGIKVTVIDSLSCAKTISYELVQYSNGWVQIITTPLRIPGDGLSRMSKISRESFLIATKEGDFYVFINSKLKKLSVNQLGKFSQTNFNNHGGVKSVLFLKNQIFVAWASTSSNCLTMEIYQSEFSDELRFNRIFRNPVCVARKLTVDGKYTSEANGIGGRLIGLKGTQLMLSIGTPNIWRGDEPVPTNSLLGRVIVLDYKSKKSTTFTTGHRNIQGICIHNGLIFATEQGPQGGDELNVLIKGKNYGWPRNSYGRPYGYEMETTTTRPETRNFASHDFGTKPIFSWVPSIAASPILCPIEGAPRNLSNSLWIGTLKDESIHRIEVSDSNEVIIDEKIPLGERIRELFALESGNGINALTDSNQFLRINFL